MTFEMCSVRESGKVLLVPSEIEALHLEYNSRNSDPGNAWNQVWNTSSTDRDPVPEIRNPPCEMQNPRLSWMCLDGGAEGAVQLNSSVRLATSCFDAKKYILCT